MELRHLRYFVAVAEELHFGRAARRLHISQPPLSQQIRALEEETGVELFARVGRHIELTAAGKEFLNYARTTLAHIAQGVRSAQSVQRGERGELGVGFMTSMSYTYLPWVLRVFRGRYPRVQLSLSEQESWAQLAALRENRLHVGILRGPVDAPEFDSVTALREPFIIALPDDHPLARARTVSLAALANESFILFPRSIAGHFYEREMKLFHDAGFTPSIAQEAVQMHIAVGLVSARIGIALVPASVRLLPMAGVVYRPLRRQDGRTEIAVVRRAGDESPTVRAFAEVAAEVISRGIAGIRKLRGK